MSKNLTILLVIYLILSIVNFYLFTASSYPLGLKLIISMLAGSALCYASFKTSKAHRGLKPILNKLFNIACLSLLLSLSLLITFENYLEVQKPIVNASTAANLPSGNYLLKVKNVSLNTKIIGHAYLKDRHRGMYNHFKHYFAIPIVTNDESRYSSWLVIYQGQRIAKRLNTQKVNKQFTLHRSYYLDSLSRFNPKNITFYSVYDHGMNNDRNDILYKSAFYTKKTTGKIKIFQPYYVDIAFYKRERSNIIYWTIAITIILLAAISWKKAIPNKTINNSSS